MLLTTAPPSAAPELESSRRRAGRRVRRNSRSGFETVCRFRRLQDDHPRS